MVSILVKDEMDCITIYETGENIVYRDAINLIIYLRMQN